VQRRMSMWVGLSWWTSNIPVSMWNWMMREWEWELEWELICE
jgi:hypothetical protein